MPALDNSGRAISFFEFWPMWLIYVPVASQWALLSIRYRSLSLPLIANPGVPLSGMVGVSKSAVFDLAGKHARQWILPWILIDVDETPIEEQLATARVSLIAAGLGYPVDGKPNTGSRGAGVTLDPNVNDVRASSRGLPVGGFILSS